MENSKPIATPTTDEPLAPDSSDAKLDGSTAVAMDSNGKTPKTSKENGSSQIPDGLASSTTMSTKPVLTPEQRYSKARMRLINIWATVGAIVIAGVIIYLMNILALPIGILIWTAIFVFCLRGIVNRFSSWGMNRAIATTLGYVIMGAILIAVILLMFSPIFGLNSQINSLLQSLPQYADAITNWVRDFQERYSTVLEDATVKRIIAEVSAAISSGASQLAEGSATGIMDAGTIIINSCVAVGFGLVLAFWVLLELPGIGREAKRIISPKYAEDAQFIHLTITRVMGGYIKGTLLQCAIIGVACGILFAIIDVPFPAALGVITGVLNIIPIVGPWLGGAAAAIMAVFASPIKAIIVIIGVIIIQQFVYTFVSPRIMASSVDVHPAVTLFALMVGSAIGGAMGGLMGSLVGMLAAIPAAAALKSIFIYYFERKTGRRIVSEDGVFFKGAPYAYESDHLPDAIADATSPHPASVETLQQRREKASRWEAFRKRLFHSSDDDNPKSKS